MGFVDRIKGGEAGGVDIENPDQVFVPVVNRDHNLGFGIEVAGDMAGKAVDDIYETCQRLMDAGVTINRPPRDGWMAFIKSPDGISIELLQKGKALSPIEPWASMKNAGNW